MNIFDEVKKLNFPPDKYVVVGSGPMAALGLKEPNDIDLVITLDLFKECKKNGWEVKQWTYPNTSGEYLQKENVELYLDVNYGDFNPTFEELFKRSEIINGVRFASLQDTLNFKKAYLTNIKKEKHIRDIAIIEGYLRKR